MDSILVLAGCSDTPMGKLALYHGSVKKKTYWVIEKARR